MAEKDGQKDEFCTYAKKKMLTAYIRVLALFPFFFLHPNEMENNEKERKTRVIIL